MNLVPLTIVVAALLGWSDPVTVQPNRSKEYHARSVANLDRPSQRTEDTLTRYDLKGHFRFDPETTLARLEKFARNGIDPVALLSERELGLEFKGILKADFKLGADGGEGQPRGQRHGGRRAKPGAL